MSKKVPPPPPKGNKRALGNKGRSPDKYTTEWIEQEALIFREWMNKEDSVFFKTFCIERGYHPNRLQEFAEKSPVFAGVLEIAKVWQESKLVNYGLFNKTNAGMTKFVLANHHGYCEKTQVAGDTANPLKFLLDQADGTSKDLFHDESDSTCSC